MTERPLCRYDRLIPGLRGDLLLLFQLLSHPRLSPPLLLSPSLPQIEQQGLVPLLVLGSGKRWGAKGGAGSQKTLSCP